MRFPSRPSRIRLGWPDSPQPAGALTSTRRLSATTSAPPTPREIVFAESSERPQRACAALAPPATRPESAATRGRGVKRGAANLTSRDGGGQAGRESACAFPLADVLSERATASEFTAAPAWPLPPRAPARQRRRSRLSRAPLYPAAGACSSVQPITAVLRAPHAAYPPHALPETVQARSSRCSSAPAAQPERRENTPAICGRASRLIATAADRWGKR